MDKQSKILVAGGSGLVGSAIIRNLQNAGFTNIMATFHHKPVQLQNVSVYQVNLIDQTQTTEFVKDTKPDYVFLSAAKVGGIMANNTYPADFIYQNLMISTNLIQASYLAKVKKLLNLGSSCIYPKFAEQPIKESYLLTGILEQTNEAYALAKIAAIKLCKYFNEQYGTNFISAMPTNLYGPNDNFDLQNSHVLPALIRKFHDAKIHQLPEVTLWGSGSPKREFLHVDDLADALVYLMNHYDYQSIGECVNIGTGTDVTILTLAQIIAETVGFQGKILHDLSKPDGTPQKLLDVTKIHQLGWQHRISLAEGIAQTYRWYLSQVSSMN